MENPFNEESAEEDGEPPFSTYRFLNFLSLQVLEGFFNEGLKAEPGVAKAKSMAMAIAGVPVTYIVFDSTCCSEPPFRLCRT